MHRRPLKAAALVLACTACGDREPTGAHPPAPGFTVLSGPRTADTAFATPRTPLVLELRDANGALVPGANVVIRSLVSDYRATMYVDRASGPLTDIAARTTDGRGRFAIDVRFGREAGPAGIVVSAVATARTDTIAFTVLPGAATRVVITPRDGAVVLGGKATQSITVRDQWGNVRPERPAVTVGEGVRLEADGGITGLAYGRAKVVARSGALVDSGSMTVVPPGRLAGLHGSSIFHAFAIDTDGSAAIPYLRRVGWPGGATRWSPDGRHLLLSIGEMWPGPFRLYELTVGDTAARLVWSPPTGTHQASPEYSPDGQWIWFVHAVGRLDYGSDGISGIWRVRRDGTGAEEVVPPPASGQGYRALTLAPAGDRIAYLHDGTIVVRTLADGSTRTIEGLEARDVRWSPDGARLLVVARREGLVVMAPDGTSRRQVRAASWVPVDASWSPDGEWVVWNGPTGVELVRVQDSLVLTLPFIGPWPMEGGWAFSWTRQP